MGESSVVRQLQVDVFNRRSKILHLSLKQTAICAKIAPI